MNRRDFTKILAAALGMTAVDGLAQSVAPPGITLHAREINLKEVFEREASRNPHLRTVGNLVAENVRVLHLSIGISDGRSEIHLHGLPADPVTGKRIAAYTFLPSKLKVFALSPTESEQLGGTLHYAPLPAVQIPTGTHSFLQMFATMLDAATAMNRERLDYHPIAQHLGELPANSNGVAALMLAQVGACPVTACPSLAQFYPGYQMFGINRGLGVGLEAGHDFRDFIAKPGANILQLATSFNNDNGNIVRPIVQVQAPAKSGDESLKAGQDLWTSIPDTVEKDRNFPRTTLGADAAYHAGRKILSNALSNLDRDIQSAAQNSGPWAGGAARDYIAWQAANGIENAVKTFESTTGLKCAGSSAGASSSKPGLSKLEAAIEHAQIMASPAFVERSFALPLYRDGEAFWKFAKAFDLASENVFNVLHKVQAIQKKAGWESKPGPAINDHPAYPGHAGLLQPVLQKVLEPAVDSFGM